MTRRANRILLATSLLGVLGGCTAEDLAAPAVAFTPGEARVVRVDLGYGATDLPVTVGEDGDLVFQGDMIVGHVNDAPAGARLVASSTSHSNLRWPDAKVRWNYGSFNTTSDADVSMRARIDAALASLEERTPLDFVFADHTGDRVEFARNPVGNADGDSLVGRQGGKQLLRLQDGTTEGVIQHEILHTVGVFHEQSSPVRDDNLVFDASCMQSGAAQNFQIELGTDIAERFDFNSIMLYDSTSYCIPDADGPWGCKCLPMLRKKKVGALPCNHCFDDDGDDFDEVILGQSPSVSDLDINGLYQMYGHELSDWAAGELFGSATAVGDFDGDGYDDLAVGVPAEARTSTAGTFVRAGVVQLFKGTRTGLAPWRLLDVAQRPVAKDGTTSAALGIYLTNGAFGSSLTVGDYDGDGVQDLAVGAPGERAVYVFLGHKNVFRDHRFGLVPFARVLGSSFGAVGATSFGKAIAAGALDRQGHSDLAISASGGPAGSGAVVVVHLSGTGLAAWATVTEWDLGATPTAGDDFGAALATGDFDGDGDKDLAVGAPTKPIDGIAQAGAVYVFRAGGGALAPWLYTVSSYFDGAGTHANQHFGAALAAGRLDGGPTDLAIGAPDYGAGAVYLYRGVSGTYPTAWRRLTSAGLATPATGDRFGASLAIGDLDGNANLDLVVGAPGAGPTGLGFAFRGGASDVSVWQSLGYPNAGYQATRLGSAVAIGDFENRGTGSAIVGDPSYGGNVGGALRFEYSGSSDALPFSIMLWEGSLGLFYIDP